MHAAACQCVTNILKDSSTVNLSAHPTKPYHSCPEEAAEPLFTHHTLAHGSPSDNMICFVSFIIVICARGYMWLELFCTGLSLHRLWGKKRKENRKEGTQRMSKGTSREVQTRQGSKQAGSIPHQQSGWNLGCKANMMTGRCPSSCNINVQ